MLKIKINKISLNDVIYDVGNVYSSHCELEKVIVKSLELNNDCIVINNHYSLFYCANGDYYYSHNNLYFSEKKATNVINDFIRQQNKRKEKYEKEKELQEKNKKRIIDEKLEEKYIGKPIMIYQENEWRKTKGKELFATEKDIYIVPYFNGHLCKLSREGKTWKMWSELEELEEEKKKLERRIKELKSIEDKQIEVIARRTEH